MSSAAFDPDAFMQEDDPEEAGKMVEIDVSSFLGETEKTTLFTFAEPSVEQIFQAQEDAARLKKRYHLFTLGLGSTIALMAMAHQSPTMQTPKGYFYAYLATKKKRMFLFLMTKFLEAYPHLRNMDEAIADAKNALSAVPED